MSTRRSTRGASRAASSRGVSPAISSANIPTTPRRSTRQASSTPLPAVGLHTSTAYGTNTAPPPTREGPPVDQEIRDVLAEQLEPLTRPASNVGSRSGRVRTTKKAPIPSPRSDVSFAEESSIFANARIESSPTSDDSHELSGIPEIEEPESGDDELITPPVSMNELNGRAERQHIEIIARKPDLVRDRVAEARARLGQSYLNPIDHVRDCAGKLWKLFKEYTIPVCVGLTALALISLLSAGQIRFYGWDIKSNLGQFVPYSVTHPFDAFNPSDVQAINRRLHDLEFKVSRLASRPSDLDPKALKNIQDMLPDYLVVKKDRSGNTIIPDNFWQALQNKIREDDTLYQGQTDQTHKSSSKDHISVHEIGKEAKKHWDRYLHENQAKLGQLNNDDFSHQFPQLLKQNKILSKSEVLDLIRRNWEDNTSEVRSEMNELKKKLDQATRKITKLQYDSKDESAAIVHDILKKFIPSGQLDALASANLKHNLNYGLTRLNHFSKGTGATIDPHLTSPDFLFPSMDVSLPERWIRAAMRNSVPIPNKADTALTKWEEHGDCWCSPAKTEDGFGPSLGVIMGSSIYPDQIVIEHIISTASLQPGAAPKDMEMLAWIPDPELYRTVKEMSDDVFRDSPAEGHRADNYVRIATWTYDIENPQNVQAFTAQLDMKALGAHTNKIIIRSNTNWGGDSIDYTCLYRVRVHGDVVATPGLY